MAKKHKAEDSSPGVPAWIVTFSDCMTLLLCFFVMLLSFSSFEEVELSQLRGIFRSRSFNSFFPITREINDSTVKPVRVDYDRTAIGAEKKSIEDEIKIVDEVHSPDIDLGSEAFMGRQTFCVHSRELFYGRGSCLTASGRSHLHKIAGYMRYMPTSRIVVAQSIGDGLTESDDESFMRAWKIIDFLIYREGISSSRFTIVDRPSDTALKSTEPVMEITLMAKSILN